MNFVDKDPYLKPYKDIIANRKNYAQRIEKRLCKGLTGGLDSFANGHHYYGLRLSDDGSSWIIREHAPNATALYLIGDFNEWRKLEAYRLKPIGDTGAWELKLSKESVHHLDLYKLWVEWQGGAAERVPAWANRVVQDSSTQLFTAQIWHPSEAYLFEHTSPELGSRPLLIYECHVGMASEEGKVASYSEFREQLLPRIAQMGYNAIQLMAIQEHPYYASFGYHVSSFFAPSSRFGTPCELKQLIDEAHRLGLLVIMDLVHSHSVKNEGDGLAYFDGSNTLYFHQGMKGEHPAWGSYLFDYGSPTVLHFLLSNCKYWLEEFHFDGFRFDGVSSMIYSHHGLGTDFCGYQSYYDGQQDNDAIAYLTLANKLIHQYKANAISIAEEVSGMPGLAVPIADGGYGFDYRLAMNIPDFWIKTIKEQSDEQWNTQSILYELSNRRSDEKTISYAESHDQALVGDKTLIFRLADAAMYWHMDKASQSLPIDRAIALVKLIRLITATTMNGGYLNFMGNEFGHPEWIDFPREGNQWSYKHARRQWSLADNPFLRYQGLQQFEQAMLALIKQYPQLHREPIVEHWHKNDEQVLCYSRGSLYFIFNFNPTQSFSDYPIPLPQGKYIQLLDSDQALFEGHGRIEGDGIHYTQAAQQTEGSNSKPVLRLYLPTRSAQVYLLEPADERLH